MLRVDLGHNEQINVEAIQHHVQDEDHEEASFLHEQVQHYACNQHTCKLTPAVILMRDCVRADVAIRVEDERVMGLSEQVGEDQQV